RLRPRQRALLVRQPVLHAVDERRSARRALLRVPSVLHRQTEAGGYRWPGRAVPAARRQTPGRQAVATVGPISGSARQGPQTTPSNGSTGGDPLRMPDGRLVAKRDAPVGGQAVLEGVMMRGVSTWAVAVRTPEGQIEIESEPLTPWAKRKALYRLPIIRGV